MDFKYYQGHLLNKTIQGAIGSYKIQNLIAAGTGGMVMQGLTDQKIKVAVKYQSFISEHETNVCLKFLEQNFSNIVNILDIFRNGEHPGFFIIMDFADMPLTKYINGKNEFADTKSQQFQSMIKQICYGFLELHQMKIIHRDFKPDNIVVKLDNNMTKYMLCDLGLDENDIKKNKQIGTPMFMAPELLNDEQYSEKVDIWALGCILYSLFARKHLFDGNTFQETLKQVCKITQQQIDDKINQIQLLDYQFKQLLIQMIQINQSKRSTIIQVIEQINQYYENINNQQIPIQQGQIQSNNQFIHQQIIVNQKPKLLPQQQLKIQYQRIERGIEIQCNQMKDKFKFKLNESEQKLYQQYCKIGQSYSSQDVQSIIKQTIQAVQSQSFDIIDQLFVVKLESDKKIILEQLGQKDLKFIDNQTELNQKLIEINKNLEKINNLQEQLKTCKSEKEQNDNIIKDLSYQLDQSQDQINQQNKQIQNQLEKICILKGQLQLQFTEFQNKEKKHQEQINIYVELQDELDLLNNVHKQKLQELQQDYNQQNQLLIKEYKKIKQMEINGLLEQNQIFQNHSRYQKQIIEQKLPEFGNQLEETQKLGAENLEQAQLTKQQQDEQRYSADHRDRNSVVLQYLENLIEYLKQQENFPSEKSDQMKINNQLISNQNEFKQNDIQSEVQIKTIISNESVSSPLSFSKDQQQFKPQNDNQQGNQQNQTPINLSQLNQSTILINQNDKIIPIQFNRKPNLLFQSQFNPQLNSQAQKLQISNHSILNQTFQKEDQK